MTRNIATSKRPRAVIVGAGFGGLAAARRLAGTPVDVTLSELALETFFPADDLTAARMLQMAAELGAG